MAKKWYTGGIQTQISRLPGPTLSPALCGQSSQNYALGLQYKTPKEGKEGSC